MASALVDTSLGVSALARAFDLVLRLENWLKADSAPIALAIFPTLLITLVVTARTSAALAGLDAPAAEGFGAMVANDWLLLSTAFTSSSSSTACSSTKKKCVQVVTVMQEPDGTLKVARYAARSKPGLQRDRPPPPTNGRLPGG